MWLLILVGTPTWAGTTGDSWEEVDSQSCQWEFQAAKLTGPATYRPTFALSTPSLGVCPEEADRDKQLCAKMLAVELFTRSANVPSWGLASMTHRIGGGYRSDEHRQIDQTAGKGRGRNTHTHTDAHTIQQHLTNQLCLWPTAIPKNTSMHTDHLEKRTFSY